MINFHDMAKALILDAKRQSTDTQFDFSNMDRLAEQLEKVFILRKGKTNVNLKNVAEYVKRLQ